MGKWARFIGDVGGSISRGLAAGMMQAEEDRRAVERERRMFEVMEPLRRQAEIERKKTAYSELWPLEEERTRKQYTLKRELEAPQRRQRMAMLQPLFEREGIIPPMDIDQGGGGVPPGYEYFADLDEDLADTMFKYLAVKRRSETSNQDFMNWLRGERLDISRQNLDLQRQRLDLSKQPPPVSEENLHYRATRWLRDHGIESWHPDYGRLLDRAMEGFRGGKQVRLSRRQQPVHLGTEMPGALGAWLFGTEPTEQWGEREVFDVEIGEGAGGRMRPPQPVGAGRPGPSGGPAFPPTPRRTPGPVSTVTPPVRQPTRALTPQEEAVLRRLRQGTVSGQ